MVSLYIQPSWRIISVAGLPMLGIASAITSVAGAAFGSGEYHKIKTSYFFAIKIGHCHGNHSGL